MGKLVYFWTKKDLITLTYSSQIEWVKLAKNLQTGLLFTIESNQFLKQLLRIYYDGLDGIIVAIKSESDNIFYVIGRKGLNIFVTYLRLCKLFFCGFFCLKIGEKSVEIKHKSKVFYIGFFKYYYAITC